MIVANLKEVIGISVGNTEIKEVWAGDSKVFPDGPTPPTPSGYYYIYRTSSNIIERRDIAQYPTVNFPAIVGNSYGGVFTDYGGKGTVATALANGDPVTFVNDRVWDDGIGYIGESNVSGATQMFNISDAITTGTTAYAPTVGAIYYVKEIPDWALLRYITFSYTKSNPYPLTNVYIVTGIDSLAYSSVVCRFKEESQSTFDTINLTAYTSCTPSGTSASIDAYKVYKTKGCPAANTGWICVSASILSTLEVGKTYDIYFELTTLDGITVHSSIKWKLAVTNLNRTGLGATEVPFEPITYDSQVEYIETSSDNCNIVTDIINSSANRRFEIDAYIPSSSAIGWLFGSMDTNSSKMYAFSLADSNDVSSYKYGSASSSTAPKLVGRYTFSTTANPKECIVTNGTDTVTYTTTGTNAVNYLLVYLLGLNYYGGGRKTIPGIKLYSAKFYDGDNATLTHNYVPVRKDGKGYLYETVEGLKLYAPKGDPITVYGADVVE